MLLDHLPRHRRQGEVLRNHQSRIDCRGDEQAPEPVRLLIREDLQLLRGTDRDPSAVAVLPATLDLGDPAESGVLITDVAREASELLELQESRKPNCVAIAFALRYSLSEVEPEE